MGGHPPIDPCIGENLEAAYAEYVRARWFWGRVALCTDLSDKTETPKGIWWVSRTETAQSSLSPIAKRRFFLWPLFSPPRFSVKRQVPFWNISMLLAAGYQWLAISSETPIIRLGFVDFVANTVHLKDVINVHVFCNICHVTVFLIIYVLDEYRWYL
jgi:hypothetical protein